ncbi:hypothetical protein BJ170DRAFT_598182 [Xylariales sp. AK1849]|nr:hypothetical protein BJ170DRAFT_598182 [Xylariales sp. AK1849]
MANIRHVILYIVIALSNASLTLSTHIKVPENNVAPAVQNVPKGKILEPRTTPMPISEIKCLGTPNDYNDPSEASASLAAFQNWCDQPGSLVPAGGSAGVVVGDVNWYMCNCYEGAHRFCARDEADEAASQIDALCGQQGAGWVWAADWLVGYGRDGASAEFNCPC